MKRIDAPETAALLQEAGVPLTQQEAESLERNLSKVASAYGRSQAKVRKLKLALRIEERHAKDLRREMRMLISVRRG